MEPVSIRIVLILPCILAAICNINATKVFIKDIDTDFSIFSYSNFEKLLSVHKDAISKGCEIDYSGVDTIKLDIPKTAKSIPLPNIIDFKNTVFVVNNEQKDLSLFTLSHELKSIDISSERLNRLDFSDIKEFYGKNVILVIQDENPWIKERKGYAIPHIRRDILIVNKGKAENTPIQPYRKDTSKPIVSYRDVTGEQIKIQNLKMFRTDQSNYNTRCLKIENSNDIEVKNIYINTPPSNLYGDAVLTFNNCANLILEDVRIEGTYSQPSKFGYGINMNNVYNSRFVNLYGVGEWGIFGTANINTVSVEDSDVNRFDIHCYGKNVACRNTLFRDLYNQFSSFYGTLKFDHCKFIHSVPVLIEGSYSAYTQFDIDFKDCIVEVDSKRPYLINMGKSTFLIDSIRPELKKIEWPNLNIRNLTIDCSSDIPDFYLYHTSSKMKIDLDSQLKIQIRNLKCKETQIKLSNSIMYFEKSQIGLD